MEVVGRLVANVLFIWYLEDSRGWALRSSRPLAVGGRHHQGSIRPGVYTTSSIPVVSALLVTPLG